MRLLPWCVLVGCWSGGASAPPPRPPPPSAPHDVELVATDATTVRFLRTSASGLVETRTESIPVSVSVMHWLGSDPVVLLVDQKGSVRVWTITATGHAEWPLPDPASWQQPHTQFLHFDPPRWNLVITRDRKVWLGRCEWGQAEDRPECLEWVYVQLGASPAALVREAPKQAPPAFTLAVAPSTAIHVDLVDDPIFKVQRARHVVRCTEGGKSHAYPPVGERNPRDSFVDIEDLRWLSADPPIFRITRIDACATSCIEPITFEGCVRSQRFASTVLVAGPLNAYVLQGHDRAFVRWGGVTLGELERETDIIDFVPRRQP